MHSSSPATFLLLNSFLPKNAVKLGRFVRRPLHPGEGYAPQTVSLPPKLVEPSLEEDVKRVLVEERSAGFGAAVTRLLKLNSSHGEISVKFIGSRTIITRRFLNADVQLEKLLNNPEVKQWLKMKAQIEAGVVYLVVGIKTFVDARVVEGYKKQKKLDAAAKLPIHELAGFFSILPDNDILDSSISVNRVSGSVSAGTSLSVGEQVFAVEYRPFRLKKQDLGPTSNLGKSTYGKDNGANGTSEPPESRDRIDAVSESYVFGLPDGYIEMHLDDQDMDEMAFLDSIDSENVVSTEQMADGSFFIYKDVE